MNKLKSDLNILIFSIVVVFLIKFAFSFLPSFGFDMGTWFGWAYKLSGSGFSGFYSSPDWTEYTPGYLYVLWLIGKLGWVNELAIKVPVILADIAVGSLIYSIVFKVNKKLALTSFFLYTLNPVVIFDGSVWGQIDGLLTFFLFLSAYFLIEKKNFVLSLFLWSVAFVIKPQSIAVLPAFFLFIFIGRFKWKEIVTGGIVGGLTMILLSLPFFPENPILGLPQLVLKMTDYYSYTSVNAFNIWSWVGLWVSDKIIFMNLSYSTWGTLLLIGSILLTLFVFRNKLSSVSQSPDKINKKANSYLLFAILSLCFFVFPTKVHERYIFPFFAFLITSAGLSGSLNQFLIYTIASLANFLNLYYPYVYYNKNFLNSEALYNLSYALAKPIGFIYLAIYFILLKIEKIKELKFSFNFSKKSNILEKFPKTKLTEKKIKIILGGILIFAFVTRIFNLGNPQKEYFDEVYHAFTAKVMMHEDANKAWEWWNTPPEGFAYEWTHPPLAKLGMVLGMKIFGENSFGYRIPGAILGTLSVYLIYLISKHLFKDDLIGLLSASVFSLDGLTLVMSRIGMNDSYFLFFALLSIYMFMRNRNFLSALSFGFSLASKWSAIWAIPILFILWLKRKNKFEFSNLWFVILPFSVYFLSYVPMFLTGHTLSIWWEMQKQMWWYHTGLKATHSYTSMWWSWPFLIRPVYVYTSDEIGGWVARIYAMGNPIVFWFGLSSIVSGFIYAFVEKNKRIGFIVFSYLIFFVPWAASPRIMFFYHYLPSIPFLAIATGYILRRNPKLIFVYFPICLLVFIYFYPHWAGLQVPLWLDKSYYWIPSWR